MTNTKLKIQKTSRFAYWILNVLKYLLIASLAELVVVSALYVDAQSRQHVEMMGALERVMSRMVPVAPSGAGVHPAFFLSWVLRVVHQSIFIALIWQLAKVFRSISRTGQPFSESYIQPIQRSFRLALAMFLVGSVKCDPGAVMETGVADFQFSLDLSWLAALALVECLLSIFDYGCQLQRESDETL